MLGVITTKDLLTHAVTIVSEFGARAYLRCLYGALFSTKPVTFLGCIRDELRAEG